LLHTCQDRVDGNTQLMRGPLGGLKYREKAEDLMDNELESLGQLSMQEPSWPAFVVHSLCFGFRGKLTTTDSRRSVA
jgi:hypothetical protein